jgi:phage gpG-like protein
MKPPKLDGGPGGWIVEQEIDLSDVFDVDLSEADGLKEALGQAIIDHMAKRAQGGDGVLIDSKGKGTPKKLKSPYSDDYEDSLEFKAAGKSKGDVNMTLTGDMLASMDVISTDGSTLVIGFSDSEQAAKAHGHMTGANGSGRLPKREFFGISRDELEDIAKEFEADIQALRDGAEPMTDREGLGLDAMVEVRDGKFRFGDLEDED